MDLANGVLKHAENNNGPFYGNRCKIIVLSAFRVPVKHHRSTRWSVHTFQVRMRCVSGLCLYECVRDKERGAAFDTSTCLCVKHLRVAVS